MESGVRDSVYTKFFFDVFLSSLVFRVSGCGLRVSGSHWNTRGKHVPILTEAILQSIDGKMMLA